MFPGVERIAALGKMFGESPAWITWGTGKRLRPASERKRVQRARPSAESGSSRHA
jgi:hypothetical protein